MSDETPTSALFTPLNLRGTVIPNRIGVSPMCTYSAGPDGVATNWHLAHLGSRAAGGAGIVFTEATSVTSEGRITDGDLGLWNDEQEGRLTEVAALIRECGSVPGIQLSHAGRKGGRTVPWRGYEPIATEVWGPLYSPSPSPFREGWTDPVEMSTTDIDGVIADFTDAAARAQRAGFEVIELHYAHGYLVHQFLSPLVNTRRDDHGGDLADRARIAVRIAETVRARVGDDLTLFARLSVVDWVEGGLTLDDAVEVSRMLSAAGIDLIDCSSGAAVDGEKVPAAPLYQVGFADRIKREAEVATAAVGLITEAEDADRIIRDDSADLVMLGRAMLRDPYWARVAARELQSTALPRIPVPYRRAVERMNRQTQW